MKNLSLIVIILGFCQPTFSQTPFKNIWQAYIITFGTTPNSREVKKMQDNGTIDATTTDQAIKYFNTYIFKHRKTIQKDIIRRAYFIVFNEYPNSQNIEDMYATTEKKGKNFTDFVHEFKTYFKDGVSEPE